MGPQNQLKRQYNLRIVLENNHLILVLKLKKFKLLTEEFVKNSFCNSTKNTNDLAKSVTTRASRTAF
ncbi:unnamed protein product [Rhizophagus irregularis]|uniref:Uncharacterized protein n=1 Tax=Rhizophagus irregularis TaxID=588596 RepID=A0A915ZGA9_9GLOM|nr:unnamed protein product [Rhizophagus irregularis]